MGISDEYSHYQFEQLKMLPRLKALQLNIWAMIILDQNNLCCDQEGFITGVIGAKSSPSRRQIVFGYSPAVTGWTTLISPVLLDLQL
jgi:hypothetical protein